ncbi:MAG: Fe-S-containing protein [Bacillota bacterium]|nr:Fe-S-containing protein [Bacillota bacterium]
MSKKQEFIEKKNKRQKANRVVIGIVALLGVLGITIFMVVNSTSPSQSVTRWEGGTYNIGSQISYQGKILGMTDIELIQTDEGAVGFTLEDLKQSELIYSNFYFNGESNRVPVMAYISPAGRVVVAVSLCEPCQSESFHISGNELVCDTCRTKWLLNDLRGISGGCLTYPPEELNYTVDEGYINILEADLKSWGPRETKGM